MKTEPEATQNAPPTMTQTQSTSMLPTPLNAHAHVQVKQEHPLKPYNVPSFSLEDQELMKMMNASDSDNESNLSLDMDYINTEILGLTDST